MKAPHVSIIIPTYNRSHLLRETIESVLAQTYTPIEVIVVDDGSTDDTPDVLARYGSRVRSIRTANAGGTAARNTGIRAAHGDLISVLDHDDLLLPDKIARQAALFRDHPEYGAVYCRWYAIDAVGERLERIGVLPVGDLAEQLVLGCFIWSGGPLIRRAWLERVGLFNAAIWSSDWDMWLRLALAGCVFGCVQEPLGCYRILHDSTMANVARTERDDIGLFTTAFAHPRLSGAPQSLRQQALANWQFWLSRRYYATGAPDDGKRVFAAALASDPALGNDRARIIQTLVDEALDVRVRDALAFICDVCDHLPDDVAWLADERPRLLQRIQMGRALRAFQRGTVAEAQALLRLARPIERASFAEALFARAMRVPDAPDIFLDRVFAHLPAEEQHLRDLERRALADVHVGYAFEAAQNGRMRQAGVQMLRGVYQRPRWLRNRGVRAVLARSVLPWGW